MGQILDKESSKNELYFNKKKQRSFNHTLYALLGSIYITHIKKTQPASSKIF